MILLNAHKLEFSLPGRTLLESVDLTLERGDKVGLIGRNGSGKSTLLRLLSGQLKPDGGNITLRSGVTLRCLDQLPQLTDCDGLSLREVVTRGAPELMKLRQRYESICEQMESGAGDQGELEAELNKLTDRLTTADAWDLETHAERLLTTVGFNNPDQPFSGLSGGEQKRVAMARTLLVPPDILLLDEPTNHLDIATISWLEEFLRKAPFTVLMVTHDRFFLERVCQRIFEVADQTVGNFEGNYSQYLELKAEREAMKARQQERFDNVLRQETAWLRQGPKARSTKQKARLQRIQKMLEDGSGILSEPGQTEEQAWDLGTKRLGKKVAYLNVSSHKILKPLEVRIEPGERIGLVGSNGSGKTTFLELLAQKQSPDDGEVEIGETVSPGYFDQHTDRLAHLPPDTRVLDAVKDVAHSVPLGNGKSLTAARLCEMFLFTGSQQATPLEKLSGGERKRLELLRILIARPNLILADEPTNDLDIETLGRLEFFLDSFPGCVCVASHDRFLLQRLCDRIFIFRDGHLTEANPSVLDEVSAEFFQLQSESKAKQKKTPPPTTSSTQAQKRKLTYREQSELTTLEESIPKWESELESLNEEISAKASSYSAIKELVEKKERLEAELENGLERWAELEELRESLST